MQKKVLIIEDNSKWLKKINEAADDVSYHTEVFAVTNLKDAYLAAMEQRIDLFIIDIILNATTAGDTSGMKFADDIRQNVKYRFTPIIFVTALEDPKLKAYSNIHCYSYVEKPFDKEELTKIIEEALTIPLKKDTDKEFIYFRKEGILHGFRVNEIEYAESNLHKTIVHSIYETICIPRHSIKNLIEKLGPDLFIQCNRGVIINRNYIEYIDSANRYIKLRDIDAQIEIGSVFKSRFLREIKNE